MTTPKGAQDSSDKKNNISALRRELDAARSRMAELENELEKAVDIFEGIVEATRDGIMIEDESGRVSYANNGLMQMLGYANRDEVLQRPWSHFFSLDAEKKIPGARGMYESLLVTSDGSRIPILITSSSFYFKGEYMGVLSVIKDITERKKFEESLARSEKFAAIAQLTMGISHEIKNPLSVLQAHVDLIKNKNEIKSIDNEKIHYSLKVISEQSERIASTISSLSSLAQDKESVMKPLNVLLSLQNAAEMFHPKLHKSHITLYAEWDPDDAVVIEADEGKLLQLLTNLMFNAIESMPGGGELWLGVERAAGGVEIRVSDTGIGIPEDLKKRIFDPFFTTKPKGTGMGLTICQGIVDKHNGRMHIESRPGNGTTIRIHLPGKQR